MKGVLARRLWGGALLFVALSMGTFALGELAPGDPLSSLRLESGYAPEKIAIIEQRYGLDLPVWQRYLRWVRSVAEGEMGFSIVYKSPVSDLLRPRVLNTLLLVTAALLLSWGSALPLALWSETEGRGRWLGRLGEGLAATVLGLPRLMLALAGVWIASWFEVLPLGGMRSLDAESLGWLGRQLDLALHLVVPAGVLALGWWPTVFLHARAAIKEALEAPYLRAALAYGLPRWCWLWGYVLPAASNPLISLLGLSLASLLSASLLVELLLGWPGVGPLLLEAILARDLHVVMASVLLSGGLLWLGQTMADLLLHLIDPRLRSGADS